MLQSALEDSLFGMINERYIHLHVQVLNLKFIGPDKFRILQ